MISSVKPNDSFDDKGRFILRSYHQKPTFSSFLPGISGLFGIPMWVFYNNRGQAISSFGIESKDRPILEFYPANKSYQLTEQLGFRTFIKSGNWVAEPFTSIPNTAVTRDMFIGMNELEIRETDLEKKIETTVLYFNLINEPYAGLVRRTSIRNLGPTTVDLEVLDGLPEILPNGVNNDHLKNISNTIQAWMEILHLESRVPFFRLRASVKDSSSVQSIEAGNYALAASYDGLLSPVVDPRLIFGSDTSYRQPLNLAEKGLSNLLAMTQTVEGRTPCVFFGDRFSLAPDETYQINSIYGYAKNYPVLDQLQKQILNPDYLLEKLAQARDLTNQLTEPISTKTGSRLFDAYCRQTFLDNLLRGGSPQLLGGKHIYYSYSRKHGDPERDYNYFNLSAENYSQGNGNFRDVNQNRRSDIYFEPLVADFNIRLFMSLIQTDGYNPLLVEGTLFSLDREHRDSVLKLVKNPGILAQLLNDSFSPGQLLDRAIESGLTVSPQELIEKVIGLSHQHIQAEFHEGYWVDHWTYSLDLIDSFLNVYPDRKDELLYTSEPLPFFDSTMMVNPRSRKYILDNDQPRQLNAVIELEEKETLLNDRKHGRNWVRSNYGQGEIFQLNLFSKLIFLSIIKFSTRDPHGMGIEMEAGRPAWCDALNGLPGLFGSSMSESFELARLLDFLISEMKIAAYQVNLPIEMADLLSEILTQLDKDQAAFDYWDAVTTSREKYRERTKFGVDGRTSQYSPIEMLSVLEKMRKSVQAGIDQAVKIGGGLTPTYFSCQVLDFERIDDNNPEKLVFFKPLRFKSNPLPLFLEGPVHQMKTLQDKQERLALYHEVKQSQLFDRDLKTYRSNESLSDQPFSIGRIRAFSPGWLENESIFMHMTYKYLLETLKAGLYEQFFEDIQKCFPPFLDPEVYGRSPLENSSFVVSSAHPDRSLHGRGYVARLSGTTAEFISIWFIIMTGGEPFSIYQKGKLQFSLRPILPGWLFPEEGIIEFRFLGNILVRVHNPSRKNTWESTPAKYVLCDADTEISVNPSSISESVSRSIRDGLYHQIDIHY